MTKRNINIEFARILCAILVISTHVLNRFYLDENGSLRDKVCMLSTLCIVAVPCFLMITGYYTRKGQSWISKLNKTVTSIVCPTLLVVVISVASFRWMTHSVSLRESVCTADYRNILAACLSWQINTLPGCGHLWYVPALFRLILFFPLLSYLCCDDKHANAARRSLYLLYALSVFWNDLLQIIPLPNVYFYNPIDSRILFFLLGYEFNTIDYAKYPIRIWALITFAGCILMYLMTRWQFAVKASFTDYFYHYQTIPCMIASFGCFGLFLRLPLHELPETTKKGVLLVAKQTWYVYLLHVMPLNYLRTGRFSGTVSLPGLILLITVTTIISFLAAFFLNTLLGFIPSRKLPVFSRSVKTHNDRN